MGNRCYSRLRVTTDLYQVDRMFYQAIFHVGSNVYKTDLAQFNSYGNSKDIFIEIGQTPLRSCSVEFLIYSPQKVLITIKPVDCLIFRFPLGDSQIQSHISKDMEKEWNNITLKSTTDNSVVHDDANYIALAIKERM